MTIVMDRMMLCAAAFILPKVVTVVDSTTLTSV